jgi:hypothetical protein
VSRRRKPVPQEPYPADALPVICTGGGGHAVQEIADVRIAADGRTIEWLRKGRRKAPITNWRPADGTYTFRFRCRQCTPPRDERLRQPKLREAITGLRQLGACALDISRLPC